MKVFRNGDIIAREGEIGKEFYCLIKGKVGAYKDHLLISEFSEKGTIFGELAAILKRPRSLTLVAHEETHVLVFDKGYEDLVAKHYDFAKKMLVFLAERLENTTDKLWAIKSVIGNSLIENKLTKNENSD